MLSCRHPRYHSAKRSDTRHWIRRWRCAAHTSRLAQRPVSPYRFRPTPGAAPASSRAPAILDLLREAPLTAFPFIDTRAGRNTSRKGQGETVSKDCEPLLSRHRFRLTHLISLSLDDVFRPTDSAATFMSVIRDIGSSLALAGFQRLVLYNFHGAECGMA